MDIIANLLFLLLLNRTLSTKCNKEKKNKLHVYRHKDIKTQMKIKT